MNKAIIINKNTCKECNLCTEVCPNKILIKKKSNGIAFRDDRVNLCLKCGQCMTICSSKSITVSGLSYDKDFFQFSEDESYENAFYELIYTRRAIRNFKNRPVSKDLLEKIVRAISFAPPGYTPIKYEITVVSDPEIIRRSLPHMINLYSSLVDVMKNPIKRFVVKKKVGIQKYNLMQEHLIPLLKSRLPELREGVEDTLTRHAPALILFHLDKNGVDAHEDIMVAATYGMLAAHSLGLGGSIMSILPPAIDKSEALRRLFNIPESNQVLSSIIIGHPKYKYRRGIKRAIKKVTWL